jgi:hypothetical protein
MGAFDAAGVAYNQIQITHLMQNTIEADVG